MRQSQHSMKKMNFFESLRSISAVVNSREKRDMLAKVILIYSDDENSSESEPDDDEHEYLVCRIEFVGEYKFEQHGRTSGHWG